MPLKGINAVDSVRDNACSSLYQQVKQQIQEQIASGNLSHGEKLPGMKDLASLFGVSLITIDTALNQLIDEGVCYRRPKKGTYIGSTNLSQSSVTQRQRLVVVYSEAGNIEFDSVMKPFLSGVNSAVSQLDRIDMLLLAGTELGPRLAQLQSNPCFQVVGVVVACCFCLGNILPVIRRYPGVKFALLNYQFSEFAATTPDNLFGVFNDDFCGGYSATSNLLHRGFRKIGVIHYHVPGLNYQLRLKGYRQAHEDMGIIPDNELIYDTAEWAELPPIEQGAEAARQLLSRKTPDAIFCINDLLAAGASSYLRTTNNRCVKTIMGFDNLVPELSYRRGFDTVAIDAEQMGQCAVRSLIERKMYPGKQIFIAPQVLLRNNGTE